MKITKVNVLRLEGKNGLLGFAEIVMDDCWAVRDLKIIRCRNGYHVAMPQEQLKSGNFRDIAYPLDEDTKKDDRGGGDC